MLNFDETCESNNSSKQYFDCSLGSDPNQDNCDNSFESVKTSPDYIINSPVLLRGFHFKEDAKLGFPMHEDDFGHRRILSSRLLKLASNNPVMPEKAYESCESDESCGNFFGESQLEPSSCGMVNLLSRMQGPTENTPANDF